MAAHRRMRVCAAIISGKVRETGGNRLHIERGATKMAGDSNHGGRDRNGHFPFERLYRKDYCLFWSPSWAATARKPTTENLAVGVV